MRQDDDLLTTAEVAHILRVSTTTVSRWAKDGTIKSVRIGKLLRYRRSDLDEMLATPGTTA